MPISNALYTDKTLKTGECRQKVLLTRYPFRSLTIRKYFRQRPAIRLIFSLSLRWAFRCFSLNNFISKS